MNRQMPMPPQQEPQRQEDHDGADAPAAARSHSESPHGLHGVVSYVVVQRTLLVVVTGPSLAALLLFVAACAREESGPRFMVRDSAGIAVVESTVPAWSEEEVWIVESSPLIDLAEAGEGPDYEFFSATDATRLSDGSFVVADDGDDEIRIFSPEGIHSRTLGRAGDGPGEFQRLDQVIALPGDSILAYDFWQARITVFDPEGRTARIVTLDGAYRPRPLIPLASGGYVGKSTDFTGFGDRAGLHRMLSPIVRVNQDGVASDTLSTIPGGESVVFGGGDAWALWGKNSHLAVHGNDVYVGSADSVEYQVLSPDGELQRLVRIPGYDLTLSQHEVESEYAAFMPDPSNASPVLREIMDQQPDRSHRPAYSDIVIDVHANVWLKRFQGRHEESEPTVWFVFDLSGEWLGSVALPAQFDVFRIGSDWIVGKRPDELDVQHVQLLRLTRR